MSLLEFHRTLLSDVAAQSAFRKAILATICGGEAVLDLGTGTGIHAMFACQAGARTVYAVDQSPVIELAQVVCEVNGFADRITFHHGAAEDVELPERVDVITAHLGLADTLAILPKVRAKHLRPGGIVIPASIDLFCAPLDSVPAYKQILFWDQLQYGLDFRPVRSFATHSRYACRINSDELLCDGIQLICFDLINSVDELDIKAEFEITRGGILHGIAMWYVEHLSNDITISTGPPSSLHPKLWPNQFFPCETPAWVHRGDRVTVRFRAGAALTSDWNWEITVRSCKGRIDCVPAGRSNTVPVS
jgi:SAM-dependent methyltransferase